MYKAGGVMSNNPSYRATFIRAYPGIRLQGRPGFWYRCAYCGRWCARPGGDKVKIPDFMKMEVDHIKPWSQGGSDELWNLQALCKPCNRAKSGTITPMDVRRIKHNNVVHGDGITGSLRHKFRQSKILKAFGLNKRK